MGLGPALENLAGDFEERTHITTSVSAPRFKGSLPDDTKIVLYRICQEALTNIHRHAHASHVEITVLKGQKTITLKVEDDGVGFGASNQKKTNNSAYNKVGLGLTNMHERIESREGRIDISSNKEGTLLTIQLPVAYLPAVVLTKPRDK